MSMKYIKLFADFLETVEQLNDAEVGRLVKAMLEYALDDEASGKALEGNERFLFPSMRRQIDWEREAYEAMVKRNAANGKKGGRPRSGE